MRCSQNEVCFDDGDSMSIKIIEQLAAAEDVDPKDFPSLYPTIDLEALDRLIESGRSDVKVTFSTNGYDVTVTSDGVVDLTS